MAAGVVDRIELPAGVEQRDLVPANLDRLAAAVGNFATPSDFYEVCHAPACLRFCAQIVVGGDPPMQR
jgi:hypothetical protein